MPTSVTTSARYAIFWLCLATFGRAAGENAIRIFMLRSLVERPAPNEDSPESLARLLIFWFILAAIPAVVLAPLIGAVAVGKFRKAILLGGTLLGVGVIAYCTFQKGPWTSLTSFLAIEAVFFAAVRYALVIPIARQARIRVATLQGLLMLMSLAGLLVGFENAYTYNPTIKVPDGSIPEALQIGFAGYMAAFVALLFLKLPAEAGNFLYDGLIRPFIRAAIDVGTVKELRRATCTLVGLFGLFLIGFQILRDVDEFGYILAIAGGVIAALGYTHPSRGLMVVPIATTAMVVAFIIGTVTQNWATYGLVVGAMIGWAVNPTLAQLQIHSKLERRGHVLALLFALCGIVAVLSCVPLFRFEASPIAGAKFLGYFGLYLAIALMIHAWASYFRGFVEGGTDMFLSSIYRISYVGDDVLDMPARGPMLVIANHAAWLDPLWLAKIWQRPTTPMMTAGFYDLPVVSFLMKNVIGTIRVAEVAIRRDAPEIQEAIQAIDRGECVVIFPEGYLRRKESQPVRRFGRGVWQILAARPDTPLYACWVEGGWGSYFSHKDGPPTTKKKFDWFRKIVVAVRYVPDVSKEMLQSHMASRSFLLQEVLKSRAMLGFTDVKLAASMEVDDKEAGE